MSWFKDVTKYILNNLDDYADQFLSPVAVIKTGKNITINPCPFCGHKDCFSLTRDFNGANCFSCGAKGSLISIVEQLRGEIVARQDLAEWSNIPYSFASYSPEQAKDRERYSRFQNICKIAVDYFHKRLNNASHTIDGKKVTAIELMINKRKHTPETVGKYKIGLSGGMYKLKENVIEKGFTEEEFEHAKKEIFGFPDGYMLFPYYNDKGHLVRINGKLFVRTCQDCDFVSVDLSKEAKVKHEKETGHTCRPDNLSKGGKENAYLYSRKNLKGKRYAIMVEGENDLLSVDEALVQLPSQYARQFLPISTGGKMPKGYFENAFFRDFEAVYECFDSDDAGDLYREQINEEMPEVMLYHIELPDRDSDIDEFLKLYSSEDEMLEKVEQFKEMIDTATVVPPKHHLIKRDGKKHVWSIRNRFAGLTYIIENFKYSKNTYTGKLQVYKNGERVTQKSGDIDAVSFPAASEDLMKMRSILSDRINDHYQHLPWIDGMPERSLEDLMDIFKITKYKEARNKQIAWYLYHASKKEREYNIDKISRVARSEQEMAYILKEMTGFVNQDIDPNDTFPEIQLSSSVFPSNGDAFAYFSMIVKDGEDFKRVPCLITNKKDIIRLDILKKKESQSLLLISGAGGKYELGREVEMALPGNSSYSLQHPFAMKWIEDKMDEESLTPARIIAEIETFIRMTYYADPDVYKVLSLWIYATYFYQLFKNGFPYLLINGSKGTGKSTLDTIIELLSFNPTFMVGTSEAALFRKTDGVGGTIILDEQENLHDKKELDKNGIGNVLRAGYADSGEIYRTDPDTGEPRGYKTFCPKVISNINGLEEVLSDRCIQINTVIAPEAELRRIENPLIYKRDKRHQVYSITSRAVISVLTHFEQAHQISTENTRLDTGNARLTQLLSPLVTIARLVGGDYEEALIRYYEEVIVSSKQEVKEQTLDGRIYLILKEISEELLGLRKDRKYIGVPHLYEKPIDYDEKHGTFEINSMHILVFVQEGDPDNPYTFKEIHAAIKVALAKTPEIVGNMKKTKTTVTDENLVRQIKNNRYPNVNVYTCNVRDFVPKHTEAFNPNKAPMF